MHGRRQDHDRGTAQRPDRSAGMDRDRTGVGTGDSRAEGPSAIRINRQKSKHSADRGGVLAYKRKPGNHMIAGFPLAGDEGFEPPQTESESGVLPLHKSPKLPQRRNASIIIAGLAHLSSVIFQKSAKAANFSAPAFSFPGSFFRALRQNRRLRAAFQLLTRKSVLFLLAGSMRGIARAAPY